MSTIFRKRIILNSYVIHIFNLLIEKESSSNFKTIETEMKPNAKMLIN